MSELTHAWIEWIGNFHPLLNHFPIALIIMTGFSELFFKYFSKPLFDHASRFMILAAACISVPTALLGFAMGYAADYSTGWELDYYGWHQLSGMILVLLTIATSYVREYSGRRGAYFLLLGLSILCVCITGYYGGSLTFGRERLIPPLIH